MARTCNVFHANAGTSGPLFNDEETGANSWINHKRCWLTRVLQRLNCGEFCTANESYRRWSLRGVLFLVAMRTCLLCVFFFFFLDRVCIFIRCDDTVLKLGRCSIKLGTRASRFCWFIFCWFFRMMNNVNIYGDSRYFFFRKFLIFWKIMEFRLVILLLFVYLFFFWEKVKEILERKMEFYLIIIL